VQFELEDPESPKRVVFTPAVEKLPVTEVAIGHPLRPLLARCVPFGLYILFLAFSSWLAGAQPGIDLRWLYAVQISLVVGALAFFRRDYSEFSTAVRVRATDWGLALLLGLGVFVLWINLDSGWAVLGEVKASFVPLDHEGGLDWPLIIVRIFGAAVVVPVMEELFWRSFIQRWIDQQNFLALAPADVSLRALLFASVVFGFEHNLWLAGIIAGLAYGFLYRRSACLWLPIVAHGLTNLLLGIWVVHAGAWQFW